MALAREKARAAQLAAEEQALRASHKSRLHPGGRTEASPDRGFLPDFDNSADTTGVSFLHISTGSVLSTVHLITVTFFFLSFFCCCWNIRYGSR